MKGYIRLSIIAAAVAMLSACGFKTIDTGKVGVPLHFSQISGDVLSDGLHFYNPFTESIVEMDTLQQKYTGKTEAYTKDVQEATIQYTLNYQLRKSAAISTYHDLGNEWADKVIPQVVLGTLKEVIGQWDAVDLIQNRQKAGAQVAKAITDALALKNIDAQGFQITDLEYSPAFNRAIEAKVIAQQSAIREQNHTVEIQQIANQKVISATAEAQSMSIRAQALEKNPKLVEWEAVQKWDGKLPQYQMGGATPFINLSTK